MTTRVLVVDDQELVRAGFSALLRNDDIEVVAEAGNGQEAVELAHRLRPDVVLMDVRMPVMDGIEATRAILADWPADGGERPRIMMLTTFDLDDYVFAALRAGAAGFLLKDTRPVELLDAVRVIARGEALLSPGITRKLIAEFARQPAPSARPSGRQLAELTEREVDVLRLVGTGRSNQEIAAELFVSEATVKTHLGRVMAKLHLSSRAQAVVVAYESGLLRPGSAGA
ncbi:response regulator transcription factor [Blastococcus sp. HT6-30]|uniref:response regulator transcription factor n=1 Tax=Blastococcus sp. HT6-30 TaxID=3144843 RepID=UPI00321AB93A